MKKTLLTLALVAATAAAFGQGKVTFGNDSLHYFVIGSANPGDTGGGTSSTNLNTVSGAPGAIPISPLPSGSSLEAVLYAGQSSSSLSLDTTIVLTGANWLANGRMANKVLTLGFAGGSVAFFEIIVTDTGATLPATINGANLPTSSIATAYFGDTGLFSATPGSSLSSPGLVSGTPTSSTWVPANLVINAVPEPASFALFGLGAAAMLIFRRRK